MDLKERLSSKLSEEEMEHLITSYDILGDLAIIKVPEELEAKKGVIADAVLAQHNNVAKILRKTGKRTGDYRVADYELLRGDTSETLHREHGCRFELDPTTVYFSERLGHERERVVSKAAEGETVVDMFAGVGPFAIELARNAGAENVYAFEANHDGYAYLKRNVELNKVEDHVEPFQGDVRDNLPPLDIEADRIVMNLPESSDEFIEVALDKVKDGGIIHFYSFYPKDELWDEAERDVQELFESAGADVAIEETEVCGHYNPAVERVCFDVRVESLGN